MTQVPGVLYPLESGRGEVVVSGRGVGGAMSKGEVDPRIKSLGEKFETLSGNSVPPGVGGRDDASLSSRVSAMEGQRASASLRHDLAGPLTAILGTAELLLLKGQNLPRDVRDSLGQILDNCGRISEILARGSNGGPGGHEGRARHRPKEH